MIPTRTGIVNARTILEEPIEAQRIAGGRWRECPVTFRQDGVAVGRRDFATHWIHWYPAKMFHRIPADILDTVELPPIATIVDPYCGSGTVLLEANVRGHDAVGIDINPLARLISRVKTTPLDPSVLQTQLELLMVRASRSRSKPAPHTTLDFWLSLPARVGLHRLSSAISKIPEENHRAFFRVALSNIVRRVSRADPAIPPLVRLNQRRSQTAGRSYRMALGDSESVTTAAVYKTFSEVAAANIRRMAELDALRPKLGHTRIASCDHDATRTGLQNGSVDVIITSPPYCGSQKYVRSLKLELLLNGCPTESLRRLDRRTLGTEAVTRRATPVTELLTGNHYVNGIIQAIYCRNPIRARMASDYSKHLFEFARECRRILKPGGHLLVTMGRSTLSGITFPSDRILGLACESLGLQMITTLVDSIPSRGLLTKRHPTAGRMDHEFVAWLRQPGQSSFGQKSIPDAVRQH